MKMVRERERVKEYRYGERETSGDGEMLNRERMDLER